MHSWPIPRAGLVAVALIATCLLFGALTGRGHAIVPPADCGRMTVATKRYNVKADQLRCRIAREHARRYLATHRRPTGYRCRDYSAQTKLKFRCSRGVKVFFAIRR